MAGDARSRYQQRARKSMRPIMVEFFPPDADIYEHLRKQRPMATYIKDLIRKDMNDDRADD